MNVREKVNYQKTQQGERLEVVYDMFALAFAQFSASHNLTGHEQSLILARMQYEHMQGIVDFQPLRDLFLDRTA